jgi:hypothetical protein
MIFFLIVTNVTRWRADKIAEASIMTQTPDQHLLFFANQDLFSNLIFPKVRIRQGVRFLDRYVYVHGSAVVRT